MYQSLRLEITNKCNLKCKYCHAAEIFESGYKEYTLTELLDIISEGKQLGCKEVVLIGGEPLLFKDFWSLVKKACIDKIILTTNLTLFNDKNLTELRKDEKIKEIRLSLDGGEGNDTYRVGSSYKDIISTTLKIKNVRPDIRLVVQTTCHEGNLDELDFLYKELKAMEIDKWRLSVVWNQGRAKRDSLVKMPEYERIIMKFKSLIEKYLKDEKPFELEIYDTYNSSLGKESYVDFSLGSNPCSYYSDTLCVGAGKEIIYCPKYRSEKTKFSKSIKEALNSSGKFECSLNKVKISDLACRDCRYLKLCGGGCRANSYLYSGDLHGADPVACNILPQVEKNIVPILPENQARVYREYIDAKGKFPNEIFDVN